MQTIITVLIKKYVTTIFFVTIIASLSLVDGVLGQEADDADGNNDNFTDTVISGPTG